MPYQKIVNVLLLWLAFGPLTVKAETLKDIVIGKDSSLRRVAEYAKLVKPGSAQLHPLDLVGLFLYLMLAFVGVIFVVQVVSGGYLWMTAGGNEEKVTKAIKKISNGAVGAAVVFFAYIITAFVLGLIGVWETPAP